MNTSVVFLATLGCAALGALLPSLWLAPKNSAKTRIPLAPNPVAPALEPDWREKARHARSPMAMLRAVIDGLPEGSASRRSHGHEDLGCTEAEELAAQLTGDDLGRHVSDAQVFLKSVSHIKDSSVRGAALSAWVDADPNGVTAALCKPDASGATDIQLRTLVVSLATRHPDKAVAALRAAPGGVSMHYVWDVIFQSFAKKEPAAALNALKAAPAGVRRTGLEAVLRTLAASNPQKALAWYEAVSPELRNGSTNESVFTTWAKSDPASALRAWMAPRNDGQPGNSLDSGTGTGFTLMSACAAQDPEAAIQWALTQGKSAAPAIADATRAMAFRDPQRALEMLTHVAPEAKKNVLVDIGQKWAQNDAAAALAWARTLPPDERPEVMAVMLPQLGSLPVEERRAVARDTGTNKPAGFRFLYDADPAEAQTVLTTLLPEEARGIRIAMSAGVLEASPALASRFVEELLHAPPLPAPKEGDPPRPIVDISSLFPSHIHSSSSSSGSSSIDGPPEDTNAQELSEVAARVTASWAERDPVAAAAWVVTLPPGEAANTAIQNLTLTWSRYDFPSAQAWVEQLPAGKAKDQAAEQIKAAEKSAGK
jgi:hypothetical protein